ncbi:MAG TPA: hypothetical protein DDX93_03635 [Smithella sp.]|jgi:hypothetical protein|nr:hypothetical protein [Smithella sp.]
MKIREHRGFQIQVHGRVDCFTVEIHRKDKLLYTVLNPDTLDGCFNTSTAAIQAALEWIDHTYPAGRIKYFG